MNDEKFTLFVVKEGMILSETKAKGMMISFLKHVERGKDLSSFNIQTFKNLCIYPNDPKFSDR